MPSAVVLLSEGLDSTTTLAIAKASGFRNRGRDERDANSSARNRLDLRQP
ncbi:MAG: 7-cyano-7-deazaguanine synthase [Gemmatimonadota bacterium]|nr:7-cyano-7-deazaguanine synthase [Gemmatimonadota bacterium]